VRSSVLSLAVVSAALVALPRPASACDSSSCAILTRGGLGTLTKGAFTVDLAYRYSDDGKRLAGSSPTEDVVLPRIDFDGQRLLPGFHRELDGSANALQADVSYGVSSRLSAFVSLPLFTSKRVVHAHVLGSHAPPSRPTPRIQTTRTATAGARGAPRRFPTSRTASATRSSACATRCWGASPAPVRGIAVKLPTGDPSCRTPSTAACTTRRCSRHGLLDTILSAQYARGRRAVQWAASASRQFTTANDLGYRFGDETILGLGLTRTLRAVYSRASVAASVQVKAHFRGRSDVPGRAGALDRQPHGHPLAGPARDDARAGSGSTGTCRCRSTATSTTCSSRRARRS
jgi:hypothetical protein